MAEVKRGVRTLAVAAIAAFAGASMSMSEPASAGKDDGIGVVLQAELADSDWVLFRAHHHYYPAYRVDKRARLCFAGEATVPCENLKRYPQLAEHIDW